MHVGLVLALALSFGACGGLINVLMVNKGRLRMPRIIPATDGSSEWDAGFLAPMAIGAVASYAMCALTVPTTFHQVTVQALLTGLGGGSALDQLLSRSKKGEPDQSAT